MADKELELDAAEAAGYARGYQTCIVDYQPTAELLKSKLAMEKRVRELADMFNKIPSVLPGTVDRFAVAKAIYEALDGEQ